MFGFLQLQHGTSKVGILKIKVRIITFIKARQINLKLAHLDQLQQCNYQQGFCTKRQKGTLIQLLTDRNEKQMSSTRH